MHENPNKNSKLNIIIINIPHFLDMSSFCFTVVSDSKQVTMSNLIVTVVF